MAFRVLIVANGFVQGAPDSFPPDVRKLFEQPHEVRVLVPTRTGRLAWLTSDTGAATREASALVSDILADMQRKGIQLTLALEGIYASVQALSADGPARRARSAAVALLDHAVQSS